MTERDKKDKKNVLQRERDREREREREREKDKEKEMQTQKFGDRQKDTVRKRQRKI
jgi:hypothetical protein